MKFRLSRRTVVSTRDPETASNASFLLLFPIFYFYYMALAEGFPVPDFGYFGTVSAAICLLFLLSFNHAVLTTVTRSAGVGSLLLLFLVWWAVWTVIPYFDTLIFVPAGAIYQLTSSFVMLLACIFAGMFLNPDARFFRRAVRWSLVGMVLISAALVNLSTLQIIPGYLFGKQARLPTYQGFAMAVSMTCFVYIATIRSAPVRIVLSCLSAGLLFLLSARSEFVGFVAAIVVVEGLYSLKRPVVLFTLIAVAVVMVVGVAFYWTDLVNSRQARLLDLSQDHSWLLRTEAHAFAVQQITQSPIWGIYGGHFFFPDGEKGGFYSHDALSAWVSFGVIGFMLYVAVSAASALKSVREAVRKNAKSYWRAAGYLNVSCFLLILFAKPVFWPVAGFGWALTLNGEWRDRRARKNLTTSEATATPSPADSRR